MIVIAILAVTWAAAHAHVAQVNPDSTEPEGDETHDDL
jgi:hypothetical protein